MGAQDAIICRLIMINPSYDAYSPFLIFWTNFGGKMATGVATMRAPNDLGPLNHTQPKGKNLAYRVDFIGQLCY